MHNPQINNLARLWAIYKEEETKAMKNRREIEDHLAKILEINPAHEGTVSLDTDKFEIKVQTRMARKVDTDLLQEIAAEHGMSNHLTDLFRWKADLDMKAWKAASPDITSVLSQAVTTTAGRPSFSITKEEI
jgi:hypothetical protein